MPNYVVNKDFYNRIKEYKKTKSKKIYEQIGKDFILIATNYLHRSNLINYSQDRKNEMISDATYYMVKYLDKFDINRFNAFAYFTTVAKNAFLQYINDQKRRDEFFTSIEYIDNMESNNENLS